MSDYTVEDKMDVLPQAQQDKYIEQRTVLKIRAHPADLLTNQTV